MRNKIWIAPVIALVIASVFAFNSCKKEIIGVTDITLDVASMTLLVGESAYIDAVISPANADNPKIVWSSEDISVVDVNNGKVRAVAPGTATVTAKADDNPAISATCKIAVYDLATKITIESETGPVPESETLTINKGEAIRLKASIRPEGSVVNGLSWRSTNKDIVTIIEGEQDVEIKGIKTGETDVVVAAAGSTVLYASCHIVVVQNAQGLSIEQTTAELYERETVKLSAKVTPEDTSDPVIWKSSDEDVATVSEGTVSAKRAGKVDIIASIGSGGDAWTDTCHVTVKCHVEGVKFDNDSLTVKPGDKRLLSATVFPERASKEVSWRSSNSSVVFVSEIGEITAKAPGTATITVITVEDGKEDDCVVTVHRPTTGIHLNKSELVLRVKETADLTATVEPADASNNNFSWSSSNPEVATVENGHVVALAVGETAICAMTVDGGYHTSCQVQVRSRVDKITLSTEEMTLYTTDILNPDTSRRTLTATVTPAGAEVDLTWKSDDETVATVKGSGNTREIVPEGCGKTTIRVTAPDGDVATAVVTVEKPVITLSPKEMTMYTHDTGNHILAATVTPADAKVDLKWKSDKETVATVKGSGNTCVVTPKGKGDTFISVSTSDGSVSATANVTVKQAYEKIGFEEKQLSLNEGDTETLGVTKTPEDADDSIVWSSSHPDVATVDQNGKVTAVKSGSATITAASRERPAVVKDICEVTVTSPVAHVTGVSVEPKTLTMYPGESKTIAATVTPENAEDKSVIWSSSNVDVATVNAGGTVEAHSTGSAMVTVKTNDGGHTATCVVTVKERPVNVTGITLDKSSFILSFGESENINATIEPANATNKTVNWSSSDPAVAKVENGIVTAMSKEGTVIITATSDDNQSLSATCTVKVVKQFVPVTGLTISPSSSKIYLGQKDTLKATVYPEGATTTVVWSVQQGGVVAVDQNGVVTPLKVGLTRVFAQTIGGEYLKSVQVTVMKNDVGSIVLPDNISDNGNKLVLKVGETYDLTVTVNGKDAAAPASNPKVTWKSGDKTVATVASFANGADASKQTGRITALKAGNTTVTVTSSDNSGTMVKFDVTVLDGGSSGGGNEGVEFDDWNF